MHAAVSSPATFDLTPELQVVRHLVSRRTERPLDGIAPHSRLHVDLGIGLLGLAVLALEIEDVTGVLLPFDALTKAASIEDLARLLHLQRRA
ncbi:MAG: phosphopantetheine-binding protein [Myxococcaceae bacterium]